MLSYLFQIRQLLTLHNNALLLLVDGAFFFVWGAYFSPVVQIQTFHFVDNVTGSRHCIGMSQNCLHFRH